MKTKCSAKQRLIQKLLEEKYKDRSNFSRIDMTDEGQWELPDGTLVRYIHKRFKFWDEKLLMWRLFYNGEEICRNRSLMDWGYYYTFIENGKRIKRFYKGVKRTDYVKVVEKS